MEVKRIPGDGNCFYHTMEKQLGIRHDVIRKRINAFMFQNESVASEIYSRIGPTRIRIGRRHHEITFEEHRSRQAQPRTWANSYDLFIACCAFKIDLISTAAKEVPNKPIYWSLERPYATMTKKRGMTKISGLLEVLGDAPRPPLFMLNTNQNHYEYFKPLVWGTKPVDLDTESRDLIAQPKKKTPRAQAPKKTAHEQKTQNKVLSEAAKGKRRLIPEPTFQYSTREHSKKTITKYHEVHHPDTSIDGAVWTGKKMTPEEYMKQKLEKKKKREAYNEMAENSNLDWQAAVDAAASSSGDAWNDLLAATNKTKKEKRK